MNKDNEYFQHKLYEAYKLDWMISHGWSLNDIMDGMNNIPEYHDKHIFNYYGNAGMRANVSMIFADWESELGFGSGTIWARYDKFCDEELQDKEYIYTLVNRMEPSIRKEVFDWYNNNINAESYEGNFVAICPKCDIGSLLTEWNEITEESFGAGIIPLLEGDFSGELKIARSCEFICPRCGEEVIGRDIIDSTERK